VPGLATGAGTLEELIEKLKFAPLICFAANGSQFETDKLPFKVEAERSNMRVLPPDGRELLA
jgi:hypothetical protein